MLPPLKQLAAASPNDEGLGGADTSVVCATSSDIDEQVKVALGLDFCCSDGQR